MNAYLNGKQLAFEDDIINPNLLSNTSLNGDSNKWNYLEGGAKWDHLDYSSDTSKLKSKYFTFYNNNDKGTISLEDNIFLPKSTYTFSMKVFNGRTPNFTNESYPFTITATIDGKEIELASVNIPVIYKWHSVSVTFNVSGNLTAIKLNVVEGIPNGSMDLTEWKLEYGNIPTPWCPSIFDYYPKLK